MAETPVTPVTVLTGFLGSGKTTLLNAMLADPRYADTAVLVNEWGEIAIDHALVRSSSENVVTLPSGCICCRVAGELLGTLRELHFQRASGAVPPFRRVVIETTGLADPAPLLATLIEMPAVAARYSLAGVVTTVDAEHGMATLDAHPEAVKQAAIADRLVITKVDRADGATVDALEARLREMNPGAVILRKGIEAPDPARFPALRVARAALVAGGGAPTVLNAANEVAVAAFLDEQIGFLDIVAIVERTLDRLPNRRIDALDDVYALDHEARATAHALIGEGARRAARA